MFLFMSPLSMIKQRKNLIVENDAFVAILFKSLASSFISLPASLKTFIYKNFRFKNK